MLPNLVKVVLRLGACLTGPIDRTLGISARPSFRTSSAAGGHAGGESNQGHREEAFALLLKR